VKNDERKLANTEADDFSFKNTTSDDHSLKSLDRKTGRLIIKLHA